MQGFNLLILLVALGSTSACKKFCRTPGTSQYECCDNGNPYFTEEVESSEVTPVEDETVTAIALEELIDVEAVQPPSSCYYYCAYDGEVYCCGDTSQPIPESHDAHKGRCPEEDEQICKGTGVFLDSKKYRAKSSGALRLVSGPGKEKKSCASDGYCSEEERCCPSKCGRKHICMKSLDEEKDEE